MDQMINTSEQLQEKPQKLSRYLSFLSQDGDNVSLLLDTLNLAIELGEVKLADSLVSEHQNNYNSNAAFNSLAGHIKLALGLYDEAIERLTTAISQGGTDPSTYLNLAHAYHFFYKPELALPILRDHSELGELFPSIYHVLYARVLHFTDAPELAIKELKKFHADNETTAESAGLLSLILFEQDDQTGEALKLANDALAKNPNAIEALVARTSLYVESGHYELALMDIQNAVELYPKNGRAWSSLAQVEFNNFNFIGAKEAAAKAVLYMDNHIGTWHLLGWAHLMLNELPDALEAFEKSYQLDRTFAETHGGLAAVYAHMGDVKQANNHIKLADKLDSEGLASTYAKMILLNQNKENEKANNLFDATLNRFNTRLGNSPRKLVEKRLYELSQLQAKSKNLH
jgi:tetratricopeptide (TPR) repeat protein